MSALFPGFAAYRGRYRGANRSQHPPRWHLQAFPGSLQGSPWSGSQHFFFSPRYESTQAQPESAPASHALPCKVAGWACESDPSRSKLGAFCRRPQMQGILQTYVGVYTAIGWKAMHQRPCDGQPKQMKTFRAVGCWIWSVASLHPHTHTHTMTPPTLACHHAGHGLGAALLTRHFGLARGGIGILRSASFFVICLDTLISLLVQCGNMLVKQICEGLQRTHACGFDLSWVGLWRCALIHRSSCQPEGGIELI